MIYTWFPADTTVYVDLPTSLPSPSPSMIPTVLPSPNPTSYFAQSSAVCASGLFQSSYKTSTYPSFSNANLDISIFSTTPYSTKIHDIFLLEQR